MMKFYVLGLGFEDGFNVFLKILFKVWININDR